MEHDLSGYLSGKFPGATEHLKWWSFCRSEISKRQFVFHFFKVIFDISLRLSRPSFGNKWNRDLCKWWTRFRDQISLLTLNFAHHFPKPLTDRLAHVNGKQQKFLVSTITKISVHTHAPSSDGYPNDMLWLVGSHVLPSSCQNPIVFS